MSSFNKLNQRYNELIVVEDVSFSGGGSRPIFNYYNHQLGKNDKKIFLIRLVYKNSLLKLLYLGILSDKIIINSLSCFKYWMVIFICYLKKNTIIYLHEAAPHAEPFAKKYPAKFKIFLRLLNKRKVAFVSDWQAKYFLNLTKISRYKVIYNNINFPYQKNNTEDMVTIGMIAYQTKNKSVSFFSKLADKAFEKNLPYKFVWIGGEGGEMKEVYHSNNVEWAGNTEQVMDALNNIDVFLFTSQADCLPLVVAEALFKGKRIVSYNQNGFAEFISGLNGCKLFETFDEDLIINMIAEVLNENVDLDKHKALAYHLCSMDNFEKRLEELINL